MSSKTRSINVQKQENKLNEFNINKMSKGHCIKHATRKRIAMKFWESRLFLKNQVVRD